MEADGPDALIRATVAGDKQAWQALVTAIAPRIEAIARSHEGLRSRGLAAQPDDVSEVVTAALERLAANEYRTLTRYREQQRTAPESGQSFDSWLYGAVDFTIREHLRKRYGRAPAAGSKSGKPRPSKREFGTQAGRLDDEHLDRSFIHTLGVTTKITARQIFAYVDSTFSKDEARAMQMYYKQESSLVEIAEALDLENEQAAHKLIRKLNARLRYKFGGQTAQ